MNNIIYLFVLLQRKRSNVFLSLLPEMVVNKLPLQTMMILLILRSIFYKLCLLMKPNQSCVVQAEIHNL